MPDIFCKQCDKKTPHQHLHSTVYGMESTHMVGSERYECSECKNSIFAAEGVGLDLDFPLDRPRQKRR